MKFPPRLWIAASTCLLLAYAPSVHAFPKDAVPRKECGECHALTAGEAQKIFGETVDNVVAVLPGPFQGIWEIDVEKAGKTYPVYLDYSRSYIFNGQIIRVRDKQNLTSQRYTDLNRIDVSTIPLADAIVLGFRFEFGSHPNLLIIKTITHFSRKQKSTPVRRQMT